MSQITLSRWGESLALRIPKKITEDKKWQAGDVFEVTTQESGILYKKVRRHKKYDIEQLLSGIDEFKAEDSAEWGEPRGREVW
jgi:antitoxin MazE